MDKSWRQQPAKLPELPDLLLQGNVFDRYDDETNTLDLGCTVRFDEYGFFMVWEPKGKDASLLDLTQIWEARPSGTIKDTRVLFDLEQRGFKDSVESRTVWITYGQDLVVVNSVFLVAKNAQIAKEWRTAVNEFIRTYKFRHACPCTAFKILSGLVFANAVAILAALLDVLSLQATPVTEHMV
uniref:PLC-beta PH domain-containing protein n=1 Tax=Ditylenchus dipsaci TaxID=166011 RepID=A0A915EH13_9BILA